MENFTNYDQEPSEDEDNEPNLTQLLKAIKNVPTVIQGNTQNQKRLQTQMPTFREQKERYNEFEHLLLNHIHPFQNKITEEEKLQLFRTFFREDTIEFWETIRVIPDTTLKEVFHKVYKENARDNFKEVSRYRWNRLKFDPEHESFSDFFQRPKKQQNKHLVRKRRSMSFLFFGKLPEAIQINLSVAGKQDATVDEVNMFIQQQYQYQQLMGTLQPQRFNEISSGPDNHLNERLIREITN